MPSLSCCPECLGEITIPSLPDPLRRLRCPLCQVEFPAHQALATSRRLPPEATLVQPETAVDSSSPFELADTRAEPFHRDAENTPSPQSAPPDIGAGQSRTDPDRFDLAPVEMPPGGITGDVGPGLMLAAAMSNPASAATATQPSDTGHEADDEADDAEPYRVQSQLGSRNKGVGVLGQLVGIFGGAIVGSAIGYYVLLWIGGARADFLDLRHKLPDWLVPGSAEAVQAERGADGEAAPESPAEGFFAGRRGHIQQDDPDGPTAGPGETEQPTDVAAAGTPPPAGPLGESPGGESSAATGSPPSAEAVPVGPRHVTPYTPDELAGILAETGSKVICPVCDATGLVRRVQESPGNGAQAANSAPVADSSPPQVACPECTGRAAKGLTPEAYDELCRLAEAVTLVRIDADDPSFSNRRRAVQSLMLRAVGDGEKRHTVGRLAGMRLEAGSRLNNGVALAGTVQDLAQEGSLHRTRLVLFGAPKLVTVLSREAPQPALKPQDRVLILGIVIDNPRENLAGYAGDLSQVVWGGLAQKLGVAP